MDATLPVWISSSRSSRTRSITHRSTPTSHRSPGCAYHFFSDAWSGVSFRNPLPDIALSIPPAFQLRRPEFCSGCPQLQTPVRGRLINLSRQHSKGEGGRCSTGLPLWQARTFDATTFCRPRDDRTGRIWVRCPDPGRRASFPTARDTVPRPVRPGARATSRPSAAETSRA